MPTEPNDRADSRKADEDERRIIRDAMDRLLAGKPIRSDGKLTIKSLAIEAGVKRWRLTHEHKDLQAEFRARKARQGETPEAFKKTAEENEALKERLRGATSQLQQASAELKQYARVVQVLTLEKLSLEEQLKDLSTELTGRPAPGKAN